MRHSLWLAICLMMATLPTRAQQAPKTWSITPKTRVAMSRLTGDATFNFVQTSWDGTTASMNSALSTDPNKPDGRNSTIMLTVGYKINL